MKTISIIRTLITETDLSKHQVYQMLIMWSLKQMNGSLGALIQKDVTRWARKHKKRIAQFSLEAVRESYRERVIEQIVTELDARRRENNRISNEAEATGHAMRQAQFQAAWDECQWIQQRIEQLRREAENEAYKEFATWLEESDML